MTVTGDKDNEEQTTQSIEEELSTPFEDDSENVEDLNNEEDKENIGSSNNEVKSLQEALARNQADYLNFKKRVERDREDMIYFIKVDILKKILPRLDDLNRIIKNSPEDFKGSSIYEGILILEKNMIKDLESMGIKSFNSIGEPVDPEKHEVMTQIPSETPGIIVDEFEKGYMIGDRVLRVAKVVVGA